MHAMKPHSEPTSLVSDPEYNENFHIGHTTGREDGLNGRFEQHRAALNYARPGFDAGYLAGQRLAKIEKARHAKTRR